MTPETIKEERTSPEATETVPETPASPTYHIHINKDKEIHLLTHLVHEVKALHATQQKIHAEITDLRQQVNPPKDHEALLQLEKTSDKAKPAEKLLYYMNALLLLMLAVMLLMVAGFEYLKRSEPKTPEAQLLPI